MEQTTNNTQYTQDDVIDIRELFSVIKRRKKLILFVTGLLVLLALIYAFTATPWYQADTTVEIGKYRDGKTGKEIYLEDGKKAVKRLTILYKDTKDRGTKIKSITSPSPQFIHITTLSKDKQLALAETQKVIVYLQNKYQKTFDEFIVKRQPKLNQIDRDIFEITHYRVTDIVEKIDYIKKVTLPTIDKKMTTIDLDLKNSLEQRGQAIKNLSSLNNEATLMALRLTQIQGLEDKITRYKIVLIDLKTEKQKYISSVLPGLERNLEKLKKIDISALQEKRKSIMLSMQPHNYQNIAIVESITKDTPVKPKKKLVVVTAFITGLMLSVFLALFLEFIANTRKEKEGN